MQKNILLKKICQNLYSNFGSRMKFTVNFYIKKRFDLMALIFNGNSEIGGAQVRSNLYYLILLRHRLNKRGQKSDF